MNKWGSAAVLILVITVSGFAAGSGPQIQVLDGKMSVTAEAVSLSRLLRLLDEATGMHSKVPAELANRNISVRFSGLDVDEGIRKVFQGQPIDYMVVAGQGIIITAVSQAITAADSAPAQPYNQVSPQQTDQPFPQDGQPAFFPPAAGAPPQPGVNTPFGVVPGNPGFNPAQQQGQQGQQPAVIQTPFGPIPNPRATQPAQPNGTTTSQPNPFAITAPPFGTNSPFGNPNGNTTGADLFGNPQQQNQPSPFGMPTSSPGSIPGLNPAPIRP